MTSRALSELIYTSLQAPRLKESGIDKTIEVSSTTIQAPDPVLGLDPGPKPNCWHADCIFEWNSPSRNRIGRNLDCKHGGEGATSRAKAVSGHMSVKQSTIGSMKGTFVQRDVTTRASGTPGRPMTVNRSFQ